MNTLTGGGVKDDEEQAVMPDYSDIWDIKPFKDDEFWFMKIGMPVKITSQTCRGIIVQLNTSFFR